MVRTVKTWLCTVTESEIAVRGRAFSGDLGAAYDWLWLRSEPSPPTVASSRSIRIVDLFSGCGAMTLGVAEACRALGLTPKPLVAVDIDPKALDVYARNFPKARVYGGPVELLLPS